MKKLKAVYPTDGDANGADNMENSLPAPLQFYSQVYKKKIFKICSQKT